MELNVAGETVSSLICCGEAKVSRGCFQFNLGLYKKEDSMEEMWELIDRYLVWICCLSVQDENFQPWQSRIIYKSKSDQSEIILQGLYINNSKKLYSRINIHIHNFRSQLAWICIKHLQQPTGFMRNRQEKSLQLPNAT